jgi:hypothetical protein
MNEDTLVVVHCYAGDEHQVRAFLPEYLHHGCPVLVLSPEDAPVQIDHPYITCRSAGKACYIGRDALERQREHLKIIDEFPQSWFLLHDSDSVCVTPELPSYLYRDPSIVYGNEVDALYYIRPHGATAEEQRLFNFTYQPPVFLSHDALKKMLAVADEAMAEVPAYAQMIDYWFAALARHAGLTIRPYYGNVSRPIWTFDEAVFVRSMIERQKTVMIHSVKERQILNNIRFGESPTGPMFQIGGANVVREEQ